jgi:hypothetical protein
MLPGNTSALFRASATGNDAFTKLLLHFNGANGSTTITDSSPGAHGNATIVGNAQISTAQSKFGGSSLLLDGTGDWITFADHADYDFGSGAFTIDWWEYRQRSQSQNAAICRNTTATYMGFACGYDSPGTLQFYSASGAAAWDIANGKSLGAVTLNTWNHFAIARSGNTFYAFKNGVQTDTWTSSASLRAGGTLIVGAYSGALTYQGYLDEVRLSKGIARWTANFTPPTMPYG